MDLRFELGDPGQPKGHALVYFESGQDASLVMATYLVVLPVKIELGKYLPPMFADRLPDFGSNMPAIIPIPPIPETVSGRSYLQQLASARGDDLIFAGRVAGNPDGLMQVVSEVAQTYLAAYKQYTEPMAGLDAEPAVKPQPAPDLDAREVLYSMMGEHDRLQELSKLTGQLRYALGGGDAELTRDTVAEMEKLAKFMPAKYRMADFVRAAQVPGEQGQRLAALFIDRCYKLYSEDYTAVAQIETELRSLEADR